MPAKQVPNAPSNVYNAADSSCESIRENFQSINTFHSHIVYLILFIVNIELWKEKVLCDLQPRTFQVISLLAIVSYEKC